MQHSTMTADTAAQAHALLSLVLGEMQAAFVEKTVL